MANDIRNADDASIVTPGSMSAQVLGQVTIKTGRTTSQNIPGISTTQNGANSASDPNNIVAKYDARFDDITYYG